ALVIIDAALEPNRLNSVQELVFKQCWLDRTYQEIAEASDYDDDYIRVVGSRLWQSLSEVFGERVTKSNFRAVLRQQAQHWPERLAGVQEGGNSHATPTEISSEDSTKPRFPDGPLPLDSPFYVEHPSLEQRAYEEVRKPGALIRIRAPRQWGKTSLINRILAQTESYGYRTVRISLQQADIAIMTNLDRLLRWFCANIVRQLQLEPNLNQIWDQDLGSKVNCTTYLQTYVLSQIERPLAVILDDVHQIFEYLTVAQDFLMLLRFWHEEANNLEVWGKLRLVITHSTEVYIPLKLSQSPFNVGLPIQLPEFSLEQIQDLALRYGLDEARGERGAKNLAKIRTMLGGHPYLLHLALYQLFHRNIAIEQFLADVTMQIDLYSDHLRGCLVILQAHPELGNALKKVVISDSPVWLDSVLAYKLESMGIVVLRGNQVTLRSDLYRLYFRDRLDQV
ncbi:MAG: AAA-like domain-containing protein, partial [Pseudanabaenales cyanobacterium]|nr:AAA-like domain-containing protein [Pseudanabaenales cyanobacterium]